LNYFLINLHNLLEKITHFLKMSRTLLYEDLETLRMVQGISKTNDIKVKPDFTQEEILVSQKYAYIVS
jgi:hypothetical protein